MKEQTCWQEELDPIRFCVGVSSPSFSLPPGCCTPKPGLCVRKSRNSTEGKMQMGLKSIKKTANDRGDGNLTLQQVRLVWSCLGWGINPRKVSPIPLFPWDKGYQVPSEWCEPFPHLTSVLFEDNLLLKRPQSSKFCGFAFPPSACSLLAKERPHKHKPH